MQQRANPRGKGILSITPTPIREPSQFPSRVALLEVGCYGQPTRAEWDCINKKGVDFGSVPTYIIIALSHLSDNPQSPSHMPSGRICAIAFNWHKARFALPSVAFQ